MLRLELTDLVHDAHINLPLRVPGNGCLVLEPLNALLDAAAQGQIDCLPAGCQVAGNTGHTPALGMELDDCLPTICRVGELMVTRIAPTDGGGPWSLGENLLDRVGTRPAARLDVADLGDPPKPERGILRLQVYDELPQRGGSIRRSVCLGSVKSANRLAIPCRSN